MVIGSAFRRGIFFFPSEGNTFRQMGKIVGIKVTHVSALPKISRTAELQKRFFCMIA